MSERRPEDGPEVYRMPTTAFRMGEQVPDVQAPDPEPAPAPPKQQEPARPRRRVWDVVLTIVLLLAGIAFALFASTMALFLAFASDGCGTGCSVQLLNVGMWVALTMPWFAWLLGVVLAIVRLVRRKLAFWLPLLGAGLGVIGWLVGAAIVFSTVGWF